MSEEIWDIVSRIIQDSNFFLRYGLKRTWTSGSSTVVYPITHWVARKEIVIQIQTDLRGWNSSAKNLNEALSKHIDITRAELVRSDGSCPDKYVILYA